MSTNSNSESESTVADPNDALCGWCDEPKYMTILSHDQAREPGHDGVNFCAKHAEPVIRIVENLYPQIPSRIVGGGSTEVT